MAGPLHQTALTPDEAWGEGLRMKCACGGEVGLWERKCKSCKAKNSFPRLQKRRRRIEKWLDARIGAKVVPELEKVQLLLESAGRYDSTLREVMRRPFPGHQKKEDVKRFMRRVVNFFPSMFKSTSPRQMALGIGDAVKRSSAGLARVAWQECERILDTASGAPTRSPQGHLLGEQAERVAADLLGLSMPYVEALKTLQVAHTRMVTAYGPAREIFERGLEDSQVGSWWNRARVKIKPVGDLIRLPAAVWKNDAEREELRRLDANLSKFLESIRWFCAHYDKLRERHGLLMKTYKLSLRRHLVHSLAIRIGEAEPQKRARLVKHVLSRKGIGSLLWRLFFGLRV